MRCIYVPALNVNFIINNDWLDSNRTGKSAVGVVTSRIASFSRIIQVNTTSPAPG